MKNKIKVGENFKEDVLFLNLSNISEQSVRFDVRNMQFRMHSRPNDILGYIFT